MVLGDASIKQSKIRCAPSLNIYIIVLSLLTYEISTKVTVLIKHSIATLVCVIKVLPTAVHNTIPTVGFSLVPEGTVIIDDVTVCPLEAACPRIVLYANPHFMALTDCKI